jgi:hypothetical protein
MDVMPIMNAFALVVWGAVLLLGAYLLFKAEKPNEKFVYFLTAAVVAVSGVGLLLVGAVEFLGSIVHFFA